MSKTLVIAEKPSVGRDLSKVLPGPFTKGEGVLEGPDHIITWAVGHLVQLADPDEYDVKYAKWRMPDLPILPKKFKLVVRDERSKKQMTVVKRELDRDDVAEVVNACDAGREGELIFAYLYEKAGSKLPVQRLWLNSMTNAAIKEAFASLRPAEEFHTLEEAARSRSEADWIVGMNATRAATIRLRSSFDGAVSLGRVQTPTLAILARREQEIRDFVPEPYWVVDARFLALPEEPRRAYDGRFHAGANPRIASEPEAKAIVAACEDNTGTITKLEKRESKDRAPLLYDLTSLQSDASSRFGFTARRTLGAAQRLYEEHKALTYPRTNSRYITSDMIPDIKPIARLVGGQREYAAAAAVRHRPRHAAARPRRQQREGHRPPRDHPDARRAPSGRQDGRGRRAGSTTSSSAASWPSSTRRRCSRTRASRRPSPAARVPHARQGAAGPRLARRLRRGRRRRCGRRQPDEEDEGVEQQLPKLEQGEQAKVHRVASAAKETKPPAALLRRLAAAGDGDRRQARRRRGAARGDEGVGDRHARRPAPRSSSGCCRSATSSATVARWSSPRRA